MNSVNDASREYEIIEGLYGLGSDRLVVCLEHERFVPCRECAHGDRSSWSAAAADVNRVAAPQQR